MRRLDRIVTLDQPSSVALGMFDGGHIGHQEVLRRAVAAGKQRGLVPTVFSFLEHPARILFPDRAKPLLTTADEKARVMAHLGIELAMMVDFTLELAQTSPADFIDRVLVEQLRARHVCIGDDFTFGDKGAGTAATLQDYARTHPDSFEVEVVAQVTGSGERVSSSRLRELIAAGQVEAAHPLLGRPYVLHGTVVRGQGLGQKVLGIPTANLEVDAKKLLPADGVYAAEVEIDGRNHRGALNIGLRPTVSGANRSIEVHVLDFSGDLLGRELWLWLVHRLRAERKFPDLDALRRQIEADIAQVAAGS